MDPTISICLAIPEWPYVGVNVVSGVVGVSGVVAVIGFTEVFIDVVIVIIIVAVTIHAHIHLVFNDL